MIVPTIRFLLGPRAVALKDTEVDEAADVDTAADFDDDVVDEEVDGDDKTDVVFEGTTLAVDEVDEDEDDMRVRV